MPAEFQNQVRVAFGYQIQRIAQPQIKALPRHRVQRLCCVTDQRHTLRHIVVELAQIQRERATRANLDQFAGTVAKRLLQLLQENPQSCLHLLGHMSVRLHQRLGELETLTLQNATQRFALFLIQRLEDRSVESADIDLQLPKRLIAARLSMQPETLSRIMARLRTNGLIEIHGRTIRIPSVGSLLNTFGDNSQHTPADNVSASNSVTDNTGNSPRMINISNI